MRVLPANRRKGPVMKRHMFAVSLFVLFCSLAAAQAQDEAKKDPKRRPQRGPRVAPTHADVKYGPHERNVMDVWLAKSDEPTPVLLSIHGGGFRAGNKSVSPQVLQQCLQSGISVVALTYRLSQHEIAPAQFHDVARALQFVRSKSQEWNLDKKRFASSGGSAGAGLSLWLAFHDDMAKPDSDDPIARESTRLTCVAVTQGQTSYDPRFIRKLMPDSNAYRHPALAQLYDVDMDELDNLPKEKYALMEEVSSINHLTKDDVPAWLTYRRGLDADFEIHHASFGKVLKEKMDALGIRCEVTAAGKPIGESKNVSLVEFIQQEFAKAKYLEFTL